MDKKNLPQLIIETMDDFLENKNWNHNLLENYNGEFRVKDKNNHSGKIGGEFYTKTFDDGVIVGFILKKISFIEPDLLNNFPLTLKDSFNSSKQNDFWEIMKTISEPYNLNELTFFHRPQTPKANITEHFFSKSYLESINYVINGMVLEETKYRTHNINC
jgi:hypothetical protein